MEARKLYSAHSARMHAIEANRSRIKLDAVKALLPENLGTQSFTFLAFSLPYVSYAVVIVSSFQCHAWRPCIQVPALYVVLSFLTV